VARRSDKRWDRDVEDVDVEVVAERSGGPPEALVLPGEAAAGAGDHGVRRAGDGAGDVVGEDVDGDTGDDPHGRGPLVAVVALLSVALVAALLVLLTAPPAADHAESSRTDRRGTGRARSPDTTAFVLPPVVRGVVRPTMVAPSNLPAGLRLELGAADRRGTHIDRARVTIWSAASRQAVDVAARDGCPGGRSQPIDRATAVERARRDPASDLRWCEDDVEITPVAGPSTGTDVLVTVMETITFGRSRPDDPLRMTSVRAPDGFDVIGGPPSAERVVLRYRSRTGEQLVVRLQGGDRWSLDRYASQSSLNAGLWGGLTDIGGMTGYVVERASGTGIYLQYDDHTVVSMTAEGISGDDARAIATSLAETDPSVAPPVTPDALDRLWTQ